MKTKFFKKLSFVLALAMVLSVFAPAAGAFAAKAPKLNSTSKYLHLDVDKKNEFNFNIANKQKGWKYFWESANEDVAVVNEKNGVTTATGAGKTKVKVTITDADDEEVEVLSATVTVRDNIAKVKISNGPEDGKLAVGEEFDFNRSYVTVANNTKGSQSVTRWTVDPAEGASINDKGVFVATEAGEFTVTARSFQSKARYNAWLKDAEANADEVLAFDTTKVTVSNFMVDAKQNNLSKVDVKFSSPMTKDEVKDNIYVHYMVGNVAINEQKIKEVKMSDDGLTATVEIYDTFVPEKTYRVTFTDMDHKSFVAATTNPDDVVGINITTDKATIFKSTPIVYELLNADGVVINQPVDANNLGVRVSFESSNDLTSLYNNDIMIFKKGDVTAVTATYHTYDFVDGIEKVYKDVQSIVGVEESDLYGKEVLAWTIVDNNDPKFDDVKQFIAEDDYGYRLFVQILLSDDNKVNNKDHRLIELTSSNSNVLFVDKDGYLVPVKDGAVTVTVEYDGKFVGAFNVTVSPKRRAARLVIEDPFYSLSNAVKVNLDATWTDSVTVKAKLVDQYGADFTGGGITVKALSQRAIALEETAPFTGALFNPGGLVEGRYQYLISDAAYPALTGQVTFDVKAPVGDAVSWKVELSGTYDNGKVDVVVENTDQNNKKLNVELMGYAKNGVKTGPEYLGAANMTVNIKNAKGESIPAAAKNSNSSYNVTWVSANHLWNVASGSAISGQAIDKLKTGQYTVEILEGTTVRGRTIFTVVDSQAQPSVEVLGFRTGNVGLTAFTDTFEVKLHGDLLADKNLDPVWIRTNTNTRAYAQKVLVREYIKDKDGNVNDDYYIVHEKDIKYYITVPVEFDSYSN